MNVADIFHGHNIRDLIVAVIALLLSLLLLRIFRRAVKRSMMRREDKASPHAPDKPSEHALIQQSEQPLSIEYAAPALVASIKSARRGPRRAAAMHLAAGLVYGFFLAIAWSVEIRNELPDFRVSRLHIFAMTIFFMWPVILLLALTTSRSWRTVLLWFAAYYILSDALLALALPERANSFATGLRQWFGCFGPATLLVLVMLWRPIRAFGPIVAALTIAAAAGLFGLAELVALADLDFLESLADRTQQRNDRIISPLLVIEFINLVMDLFNPVIGTFVLLGVPVLLAVAAAYAALRGLGRLYRLQWLSDLSIQADAVVLVFTLLQAFLKMPFVGLIAFALYKFVLWIGHRISRPRAASDGAAPKLLLLRVFSLGARSERSFEVFSRFWRYQGPIRLIAGPDLAHSAVQPHEFLDFLAGRLQRYFISSHRELEQRLTEPQPRRDPDGRFRTSSFYCQDDMWQLALQRLARDSDLLLMDLRGFTLSNKGCVYELEELLQSVPLTRVLIIVDDTTDRIYFDEVLRQAWAKLGRQSLNRFDPVPLVRLYRLDGSKASGIDGLAATLAVMHKSNAIPAAA